MSIDFFIYDCVYLYIYIFCKWEIKLTNYKDIQWSARHTLPGGLPRRSRQLVNIQFLGLH